MNKRILIFFALLLSAFCLYAQKTIRGKVTDAEGGSPVPNVSVTIKGKSTGTTTDYNGEYAIQITGTNSILVFTTIGYTAREIPVESQHSINVTLTPENTQLSTVVVTALGIRRDQKSIGYAAQQIKGENLTLTKEQNVIGSLDGKIAGAQVTGSSGASLGGTQKIKLRGVNSINGEGNH